MHSGMTSETSPQERLSIVLDSHAREMAAENADAANAVRAAAAYARTLEHATATLIYHRRTESNVIHRRYALAERRRNRSSK
jgi:hypothetical protein